jgi:uncharacterized protein YdeI (YjbR/CyaY-like superfamily)
MGTRDPRIDAYIKKAAPFAQPVLIRLRTLIHKGCPGVEETLKWGHPSFSYKGILCGFASFKEHCTFGFWKGSLIVGNNKGKTQEAMGQFGRLTSLRDLPAEKVILAYVKEAARLNDEGIMPPRKTTAPAERRLTVPPILINALKKHPKARSNFEGFNYSKKKDYVEWITEAKTEETRRRRLATAIEWIAEGKGRNWKYER